MTPILTTDVMRDVPPMRTGVRIEFIDAMLQPDKRRELVATLIAGQQVFECPPPWIQEMLELLDTFEDQPVARMSQSQARVQHRATLRVGIITQAGDYLEQGTEVTIEWNRSYRLTPEGTSGSELLHEYVLRGGTDTNPCMGPVLGLITHEYLCDFRNSVGSPL